MLQGSQRAVDKLKGVFVVRFPRRFSARGATTIVGAAATATIETEIDWTILEKAMAGSPLKFPMIAAPCHPGDWRLSSTLQFSRSEGRATSSIPPARSCQARRRRDRYLHSATGQPGSATVRVRQSPRRRPERSSGGTLRQPIYPRAAPLAARPCRRPARSWLSPPWPWRSAGVRT
jgi:hypothetical protein